MKGQIADWTPIIVGLILFAVFVLVVTSSEFSNFTSQVSNALDSAIQKSTGPEKYPLMAIKLVLDFPPIDVILAVIALVVIAIIIYYGSQN